MHQTSKGLRRFLSRIDCFQDDLETVEVMILNKELLAGEEKIFQGVTKNGQPHLFSRLSSPHSRRVTIGHLRKTTSVSIIKEIYEEVMLYCSYIAHCAAIMSPQANRLVGEQECTFTANSILAKNSREDIVRMVISEVFRKIEKKKDTLFYVSVVNERLGLGVKEETISDALPYLDARHLFVHADGLADEDYKEKYPSVEIDSEGYIKLNKEVLNKVFRSVKKLVKEYDERMKENNLFPETEFQ